MSYQPVVTNSDASIKVTALAGIYSVLLGFDFLGSEADRKGFLGFAVHRTDVLENEAAWLRGQIRFKGDAGDYGDDIPTNRAPLQKFHWADFTTKPDRLYRYEVHPVFGPCETPDVRAPVVVEVATTANAGAGTQLYFNRGVTASPAYRKRFGDVAPGKVPDGSAYRWLSRGLEEALLDFIAQAARGDDLKVAIYEFEQESVIKVLKAAKARGVRVWIVYHAKPKDKQTLENRQHVKELNLAATRVVERTAVPNISHNKFIVHLKNNAPLRVWTGSTNFTEAGFYLQTNVGLAFTEPAIAAAFNEYFELLRKDLDEDHMQAETAALVGEVRQTPLQSAKTLYLSPVKGRELLDAAIGLISNAKTAIFMSSPFGLDKSLIAALNQNKVEVLEYGLVNTANRKSLQLIDRTINAWYATPASLKSYDGQLWDAKAYGNNKIHVKSIVVDPWAPSPKILIGSANFSDESVNDNDENAFLIEGDARAAAIVATEFLRVFDHYKFRDYILRAKKDVKERYLDEDESWTADYFNPGKAKYWERLAFSGS